MFSLLTMIEPVAAWLMRVTWQAAVLVGIVAVIQFLFGRLLSPRWRYALWMLVVVRLLMPALPSSPWSVFNLRIPEVAARTDIGGQRVGPRSRRSRLHRRVEDKRQAG